MTRQGTVLHPHMPRVAVADYVCTSSSLPLAHPSTISSFNTSQINRPRGGWVASGQVVILGDFGHTLLVLQAVFGMSYRSKYSNTQNHLAACVIDWTGHCTGIPRNCVSVFRLGLALALLPRVKCNDWQRQ